jgi:hypothetical protein
MCAERRNQCGTSIVIELAMTRADDIVGTRGALQPSKPVESPRPGAVQGVLAVAWTHVQSEGRQPSTHPELLSQHSLSRPSSVTTPVSLECAVDVGKCRCGCVCPCSRRECSVGGDACGALDAGGA